MSGDHDSSVSFPTALRGAFGWTHPFQVSRSLSCPLMLSLVRLMLGRVRFLVTMDYTVHGIFQARILEWVAFPFSRGSSQLRDQTHISCVAGGFFTN